ncbi:MAG TPA: PIN domain-containing protein [Candidatus Acidoferrum sp.]|nr:PIN domain-containing protein [Candidatus Acidoferrum sp.]
MALILDTDVIIAGEKGAFDLVVWLRSRAPEHVEVAAITIAELWHGVERAKGRFRSEREQYLKMMLEAVPVIPYTEQTAYQHARLWAELEGSGKRIGYYDLIVGATALERGSAVATFNTRHFRQIRGLKVIEPS